MLAADANGDGNITVDDATMIQKYIAKYPNQGQVGTQKEVPVEPTTPTESTAPTTPSTYTVYFTNSRKWSGDIYCYYWSDADHHMSSWPGEKMTFDRTNSSSQDIYKFEVPSSAEYLIFDNKSSQTVNIPFDGSALRFYAKSSTDSSGKYEYGTW